MNAVTPSPFPSLSTAGLVTVGLMAFLATVTVRAQQPPASSPDPACVITGTVTGLDLPLPGVAITARRDSVVQSATSTGTDGAFRLTLPDAVYQVTIDLTGFDRVEREVIVDRASTCSQSLSATLALTPRTASAPARPASSPTTAATGRGRGAGPALTGQPGDPAAALRALQGRFETLEVTQEQGTAALDVSVFDQAGFGDSLLPPGFGSEALADAIAITGDGARVDRGMLNDRQNAINRGDIQLVIGELAARLGAEGGFGGFNSAAAERLATLLQDGGGAALLLGGRGGRGRLQAQANYSFSGSALNSAPMQLRSELRGEETPFTRQTFGTTLGGPLRIPGLYENPNNRTNFTFQYNGNAGGNYFEQYATVPTAAMRAGDFSASSQALIDPLTGTPFADNQIPAERLSPQALALLQYFPAPNLSGTTRNYHYATTTAATGNSVNLRIQHNFSGNQGFGRGGRGGPAPSNAGQAGRGRRLLTTRTNVNMNAQVQYQQSRNDQTNAFATLGGQSESTNLGVPVSFNIQRGRVQHQIAVNYSQTRSDTRNRFTGVDNVSALAGIAGVSDDPFAWGLPALSFSSVTGLRDTTPSRRSDLRASSTYTWSRPVGRQHAVRAGGEFRYDTSSNNTEQNANGSFVFTGLYTTAGGNGGLTGFDFADFLLGLPQQATVQYGPGTTKLTGRSMAVYLQDEWRAWPNLTFNLGLRYEVTWPFIEENGRLVNLDVTNDFTAAAPVEAGSVGAYSGAFPVALVQTDRNNVGPRVGVAWRAPGALILRGSYSMQYNAGSYSSIARQLAQQPPFATTGTNIGGLSSALLLENALTGISPTVTQNNYGIDRDYVLGEVQTWNVDLQRGLGRTWQASGNYTHTRGANLDIVRAPNRNVDGTLRIDGVQPFTWQSSEGESVLHSGTFRIQRRETGGLGYAAQYTIARSRDNAPSIGGGGGGGGNVAQNDLDIESEWAQSSFVQRHRLSLDLNAELPFGDGRRWLANGGVWAALLDGWRFTANFQADAGRPQSVTVRGAARDVSTGVNGALRADYNGANVSVSDPTIDRYFNTDAFSIPEAGLFGSAPRNVIIGPGSRQLNGRLQRAIRLGGNRSATINLNVNNLLNMVNYTSVDTNVNSPTFGQVLGIRPMRSATLNLQFRF